LPFYLKMPTLRVEENSGSCISRQSVYAVAYIAYNSDPAYTATTSILRPPPCNTFCRYTGDCAAAFERHDVPSFETICAVVQGLVTLRDTPSSMMQKIIPASFGYDIFYHTRHHSHHLPLARSIFATASTWPATRRLTIRMNILPAAISPDMLKVRTTDQMLLHAPSRDEALHLWP
jgi:hypothetical protein